LYSVGYSSALEQKYCFSSIGEINKCNEFWVEG